MAQVLLASIHDVSPRFESEVDRLLDMLRPHVGGRIAMLVVPNHWGEAPIVPASPFATRLRAWAEEGLEIFLHGFFHRDESRHAATGDFLRARLMTAGEGEFLGLSRDEAVARIERGRGLIESITGRPITGFVAPAWLYGRGAIEALGDCAIPIAEDHLSVWSPVRGTRLARGAVITWASRTRLRLASSLAAASVLRQMPWSVLRVGVHPADCAHPVLVKSIAATFSRGMRHRRAGRYSDLLGG